MDWAAEEKLNSLKGKTLLGAKFDATKDLITLKFADEDEPVHLAPSGDCCSKTWIEHFDSPDLESGAEFYGFEELMSKEEQDWETIKSYQTKLNTAKGSINIEYRNSSNGYYGGSLALVYGD